ncbi:hypothetical protein Peur_010401 [Populus x canadensis]
MPSQTNGDSPTAHDDKRNDRVTDPTRQRKRSGVESETQGSSCCQIALAHIHDTTTLNMQLCLLFTSTSAAYRRSCRTSLKTQNIGCCGTTPVDAPSSSYANTNTNDGDGLSRDALFGQFFAALEKMHFFRATPDGNDDPALLDRATRLFHDALNEVEKNRCQSYDCSSLAEASKSQGAHERSPSMKWRKSSVDKVLSNCIKGVMQCKLYSDSIELYSCAISLCENNTVCHFNRGSYIEVSPSVTCAMLIALRDEPYLLEVIQQSNFHPMPLQLDPNNESIKENIRVAEQKLKEQQQRTEWDQVICASRWRRRGRHCFVGTEAPSHPYRHVILSRLLVTEWFGDRYMILLDSEIRDTIVVLNAQKSISKIDNNNMRRCRICKTVFQTKLTTTIG